MRFFSSSGKVYDFMRWRAVCVLASGILVIVSLFLLFSGRALLGTDFKGGTEVEVAFKAPVEPQEIRDAVTRAGFQSPDVIRVEDAKNPHRYLLRVHEVSTLTEETQRAFERALCFGGTPNPAECPPSVQATEVKFSPGGDKVTARF